MTAYGRGEASGQGFAFRVEIRTLNHRFLDLQLRLPKNILALEEPLRRLLGQRLSRGRVEVYVNLEYQEQLQPTLKLNRPLVEAAAALLEELRQVAGLEQPWGWEQLLAIPELITREVPAEPVAETLWPVLETAATAALEQLETMRCREGEYLGQEMTRHLESLDHHLQLIRQEAAQVPALYRQRLSERLSQLLPADHQLDPQRLAQEVAYLADRADITEELERLASHLQQFRTTLTARGPVGRKLDFLLQEMQREFNTIGAKAAGLTIVTAVLAAKSDLERLREQVQNLE